MRRDPERLPRWVAWPAALIVSLAMWWLILSAFGCSITPPAKSLPGPLSGAKETTPEAALSPPVLRALGALVADPEPVSGHVRVLSKTPCESTIPLPYILPQVRRPRVGELWQCLFVTTVCPLPPEPDWPMWIVLSTRPPGADLPLDLTPIGLTGCWLHINPDSFLTSLPAAVGDQQEGMLVREPGKGRTLLSWMPAPGMAGLKVWLQLLVASPGRSPSGWLVSHAIEVTVGS